MLSFDDSTAKKVDSFVRTVRKGDFLALLAHQPVRVQWMRDDEMARSPKSPPRSIDLEAGLDQRGDIVAWQGATSGSR